MNIVYLNGQFVPQAQATVSVMDRGFLFGDGVYEVVPVFAGNTVGFEEHMARFDRSLQGIDMKNPLTHAQWQDVLSTLIEKNNAHAGNYSGYFQVTRGADHTRSHTFSDHLTPTCVAFLTPSKTTPLEVAEKGFSAITVDDTRRRDCHIKAIALLPNILQLQLAKSKGAIEAILIRNNEVLECTSSNIFIVKDNVLLTPALSDFILSGITRRVIIALAKQHHIPVKETTITPDMLFNADEVWVTGSTKEICPIIKIDDRIVGNGKTGPLWKKMVALYNDYKTTQR